MLYVICYLFLGEVITQLKDCGATYLFTNDELSPTAHRAALETGQIKVILYDRRFLVIFKVPYFNTGLSPLPWSICIRPNPKKSRIQ